MKVVAIVLLGLWATAVYLCTRLFLWPTRHHLDAHGAKARMIDGIEVWVAGSGPRVLRFYGNGQRAEQAAAAEAHALSAQVWAVNYPGFGGSEGSASLWGVARAADTAAKAILADGKPVYVLGNSMGTTAALYVATHYPVAGVFLHNPPALKQMLLGEHGWWNLWLLAAPVSVLVPTALDSMRNAAQSKVAAVFALSEKDEVVPLKYQQLVFDAYAGHKRAILMPGKHHNAGLNAEAQQALREMIK